MQLVHQGHRTPRLMAEGRAMKECCDNCKLKKDLVKFDYSQGGCIHTDYDGFACLGFAYEGIVSHMVGCDPSTSMCEAFIPRVKEIK